jgi:hypothetical protein
MPVACLHGLWFDNFVRSPLRCDVWPSRHPSCRSGVYPQLDISKGAGVICCRERGYVSTASWKELHGPGLPSNRLGIEI